MKKIVAFLICSVLLFSLGVTAFAAGTDDGTLLVATSEDGKKYFGTEITKGCVEYVAADGSDDGFYDLNGDKTMDICDLVALTLNGTDFDLSKEFDANDAKALRLLLIGAQQ